MRQHRRSRGRRGHDTRARLRHRRGGGDTPHPGGDLGRHPLGVHRRQGLPRPVRRPRGDCRRRLCRLRLLRIRRHLHHGRPPQLTEDARRPVGLPRRQDPHSGRERRCGTRTLPPRRRHRHPRRQGIHLPRPPRRRGRDRLPRHRPHAHRPSRTAEPSGSPTTRVVTSAPPPRDRRRDAHRPRPYAPAPRLAVPRAEPPATGRVR